MSETSAEGTNDFENEVKDLFVRLEVFKQELSDQQQKLLDSILWLAWNSTKDEKPLISGFAESFSAHQASVVIDFASGAIALGDMLPLMIRSIIRP